MKKVVINAGGAIGKDNGKLVLNLDEMAQWTDEQKMIFAAAERDNVSVSENQKTVTVSLRKDLDIHADSVNLTASGYIYLGAEQDINIDQIQDGADFIFDDTGSYSNLWLTKADIENKLIDGESIREPININVDELKKTFLDYYKILCRDGERNELEQEEWLNGVLLFLQTR